MVLTGKRRKDKKEEPLTSPICVKNSDMEDVDLVALALKEGTMSMSLLLPVPLPPLPVGEEEGVGEDFPLLSLPSLTVSLPP